MSTRISKKTQAERDEVRATLADIISKAGRDSYGATTVYTVLRHVSSSGMSRDISLLVVDTETGKLRNITHASALALGEKPKERYGRWVIRVNGCGMDMGFHLVDSLGYALGKQTNGIKLHHEWV